MITEQRRSSIEKEIEEYVSSIMNEALDTTDTEDNRKILRRALHAQVGLADFPLEISDPYSDSFRAYARSGFCREYRSLFGHREGPWAHLGNSEKLEVFVSWLRGESLEEQIEAFRKAHIIKLREELKAYFDQLEDENELLEWHNEMKQMERT